MTNTYKNVSFKFINMSNIIIFIDTTEKLKLILIDKSKYLLKTLNNNKRNVCSNQTCNIKKFF